MRILPSGSRGLLELDTLEDVLRQYGALQDIVPVLDSVPAGRDTDLGALIQQPRDHWRVDDACDLLHTQSYVAVIQSTRVCARLKGGRLTTCTNTSWSNRGRCAAQSRCRLHCLPRRTTDSPRPRAALPRARHSFLERRSRSIHLSF